ncbi:MAG: hypothetical protein Q4C09_08125 [Atopobiaceae bacterium]|nr:hypothetical protein [Atopobiaceae bacterium]
MSKTDVDPREAAGIVKAIPKSNLEALQTAYGTQGEFARMLSEGGRSISRTTVNGWIKGAVRMGNDSVIHVAHMLQVSPLCILDLCARDETEAQHAEAYRRHLAEYTSYLQEWERLGSRPTEPSNYQRNLKYPDTPKELRKKLAEFKGDYRDLHKLAMDAAGFYIERCPDHKISYLLSRIAEAGRNSWA